LCSGGGRKLYFRLWRVTRFQKIDMLMLMKVAKIEKNSSLIRIDGKLV
jgi:hypothetical protein